jgi:4-amino-4-deoxy-L-arabinose transferase-like glycosyltransferase
MGWSKKDWYVLGFFALLFIIFKSSVLNLPFFWDELAIDATAGLWMAENGLSLFPGAIAMGHPPLSYMLLAIFFKLFGPGMIAARLLIFACGIIGLFFAYRIGSLIYGEAVGLIASVVTFFIPIYFSQAGMAMSTTVMIPFALASIYFALRKDITKFWIFSSLLMMTRETGLILVIVLVVYLFLERNIKLLQAVLAPPIMLFVLWLIMNKFLYGWMIYVQSQGYVQISLSNFVMQASSIFIEFFFQQYRFILFLPLMIFSLQKKSNEEMLLMIVIFSYLFLHSFVQFIPRLITFLYPLLAMLAFGTLARQKIDVKLIYGAGVAMMVLFAGVYHGERNIPAVWRLEDNMEYADSIRGHIQAAEYIETNHAGKRILTCWPMTLEMSKPFFGYVKEPMIMLDYASDNVDLADVDVIYHSVQSNCHDLPNEIDLSGYRPEKEFNVNGKISRVYSRL